MSQPRNVRQLLQFDIATHLRRWAEAQPGRGLVCLPLDVGLDEENVYAPDVLRYRPGRAPGLHDPPPYPLPDLAVEIRSLSTWRYDVGAKKSAYERHGLPELARGDTLTSPLLPGFALALDELFPAA